MKVEVRYTLVTNEVGVCGYHLYYDKDRDTWVDYFSLDSAFDTMEEAECHQEKHGGKVEVVKVARVNNMLYHLVPLGEVE